MKFPGCSSRRGWDDKASARCLSQLSLLTLLPALWNRCEASLENVRCWKPGLLAPKLDADYPQPLSGSPVLDPPMWVPTDMWIYRDASTPGVRAQVGRWQGLAILPPGLVPEPRSADLLGSGQPIRVSPPASRKVPRPPAPPEPHGRQCGVRTERGFRS